MTVQLGSVFVFTHMLHSDHCPEVLLLLGVLGVFSDSGVLNGSLYLLKKRGRAPWLVANFSVIVPATTSWEWVPGFWLPGTVPGRGLLASSGHSHWETVMFLKL